MRPVSQAPAGLGARVDRKPDCRRGAWGLGRPHTPNGNAQTPGGQTATSRSFTAAEPEPRAVLAATAAGPSDTPPPGRQPRLTAAPDAPGGPAPKAGSVPRHCTFSANEHASKPPSGTHKTSFQASSPPWTTCFRARRGGREHVVQLVLDRFRRPVRRPSGPPGQGGPHS